MPHSAKPFKEYPGKLMEFFTCTIRSIHSALCIELYKNRIKVLRTRFALLKPKVLSLQVVTLQRIKRKRHLYIAMQILHRLHCNFSFFFHYIQFRKTLITSSMYVCLLYHHSASTIHVHRYTPCNKILSE